MPRFRVHAPYEPAGHQPQAIERLVRGLHERRRDQVLLGVTGSGKTYVMAKVVEAVDRPTLVITHNKTLAAQLFSEFKEFFPENSVQYFISYYDYYQPEAYMPATGTYIEKDADINEEIDKLRHRATRSVLERRDTLIVASVSCIYGLGSPDFYRELRIPLDLGQQIDRDELLLALVDIQYERNDVAFERGRFRVRGDRIDVFPIASDTALRIETFGDEIERLSEFDPLTGKTIEEYQDIHIYPAGHYVTPGRERDRAMAAIEAELEERVRFFKEHEKHIEAQRIFERTQYDLEMIREIGYCKGIENYSRHLDGRQPGKPPSTLIDYLPDDALIIIDESHATLPQIQGMCRGDASRKDSLVEYGFRLPSAYDNRPLTWEEFDAIPVQRIHVSATPAALELSLAKGDPVELLVRPTGLVDPPIEVRPQAGQIEDLIGEVRRRADAGERTLVTTLTKRMAEDLTAFLGDAGLRVRYMHSDIGALERAELIRALRLGRFDCLVGINLLREGLDLPEVSLVAILDADKMGFLRSTRALIQTSGRAARNVNGQVIFYASEETTSILETIAECNRRRQVQLAYNEEHGIEPRSVTSAIPSPLVPGGAGQGDGGQDGEWLDGHEALVEMETLKQKMYAASADLRFEEAARYRDRILELQGSVQTIVLDLPEK